MFPEKVIIASDLCPALMSLKSCNSRNKEDLLFKILQSLFRIHQTCFTVSFVGVPADVGIEGNEKADEIAKRALKSRSCHMNVNISKSETKMVINRQITKMWQNEWNREIKGQCLFKK